MSDLQQKLRQLNLHDRASTINYGMTMTMMTMIIITKMMMIIGSLNNDDVEDNENAEKANKYSLPNLKKYICMWITLYCTFHWCRFMTYLISRFWTNVSIFFQLRYSPLEFNTRKIHQHLTNRDLEKER